MTIVDNPAQVPSSEDHNGWADFWRYKIGRNTFLSISYPTKSNWFPWKEYQNKPIPEELQKNGRLRINF
jgi:hypothetical protein